MLFGGFPVPIPDGSSMLFDSLLNNLNSEAVWKVITLAYYPDSRQEQLLRDHGGGLGCLTSLRGIAEQADLLHMMSYDQGR